MAELRLVSINIEGDKHWDTVLPFLQELNPDVVCIMEVYEEELSKLSQFPFQSFMPCTKRPFRRDESGEPRVFGSAIVSKYPIASHHTNYYSKVGSELPIFINGSSKDKYESYWYGYIAAEVTKDTQTFKVITTHFVWTHDGMPDDYQRAGLQEMKRLLADEGEHVLCGDFNIPRDMNDLSVELVQGYVNAVSLSEATSLDAQFHRVAKTPEWSRVQHFVVDYMLTTPHYQATSEPLVFGISDHAAIVTTITRS